MSTTAHIMGMDIDLLTQETFQSQMIGYLEEDGLNVVHMISLDYIDTYEKNEIVQETLSEADLILPGEKTILSAHHVDVLEMGGMCVDYRSILEFMKPIDLSDKKWYLVLRDEKEARVIKRYFYRHFSRENIIGIRTMDSGVTDEALINDINTGLPDIVLLSMDSTGQEEWLLENKGKINAKLCVVGGSIFPLIIRDNVHIPKWLKKLHLGGVYRFFARIPYTHFFRKRIFNRQMDDYITKKKIEGSIENVKTTEAFGESKKED